MARFIENVGSKGTNDLSLVWFPLLGCIYYLGFCLSQVSYCLLKSGILPLLVVSHCSQTSENSKYKFLMGDEFIWIYFQTKEMI